MSTRAWRWTRYRKALAALISEHGLEQTRQVVRTSLRRAAKRQGWKDSELAFGLAERDQEVTDVAARLEAQ